MTLVETNLPGLIILEATVFEDKRGYFYESYNARLLEKSGINNLFVQDNQARSSYGVLRGLHFQLNPHAQTKLVRVLQGEILDVVVDIRQGSPTFGQSESVILSEANRKQLFIPKGFAHGYIVLSKSAEIFYKCDEFYEPESEGGILYSDPALTIDWQLKKEEIIVSDKDINLPLLADIKNNFEFE